MPACGATVQATVGSANSTTAYRWSIDGAYAPAYDGQTSITLTLDRCWPQVTFAVAAAATCGGATLTDSRTISAGPFTKDQNGQFCVCE